jgi:Tfp pilus assembly protein PilV
MEIMKSKPIQKFTQRGSSLLEVMVSVLIIAMAILGYSRAHFTALHFMRKAHHDCLEVNQKTVTDEEIIANNLADYEVKG